VGGEEEEERGGVHTGGFFLRGLFVDNAVLKVANTLLSFSLGFSIGEGPCPAEAGRSLLHPPSSRRERTFAGVREMM
jgi:hypothetical protein